MNTAIYIRVSTEEQAREGFSIHAQKEKLTKYLELNEWNLVDYYIDDGISGKNLKDRPEVTRLIKDIKKGIINNVLIYKLDRLTRSMKDLIFLIDLFEEYNCTFNSETERIDTSNAVGRMFVKIIGLFAEFERENLAERVTFGYEQKTKEGNYTNTNGIFGYDYIIGQNKFEINELESKYVNKIYKWYKDGYSMLKIIKKLNELNVPTKRGGKWNVSTIKSILSNPTYVGKIRYGIRKKNNFITEGINIKPIIDLQLFNEVENIRLKRYKIKQKKYGSDDTYYYPVLICGKCMGKMHAKQQIQNNKKYITYKCNGRFNASCNAPGFSHIKLEDSFINYLNNFNKLKYVDCIEKIKSNNFNKLKDIITDIKYNYINLNNHEKKIFLERFINKIIVLKINNKVVIKEVLFN